MTKTKEMKIGILDLRTVGEKFDFESLHGFGEVHFFDLDNSEEAVEVVHDLDIIIVNKIKITRKVLESAKCLKLICVTATGTNNIDVEYARKNNIVIKNVQDYCTNSVAQHMFSMLFHLISKVTEHDNYVKSGDYSDALISQPTLKHNTPELYGKTVGVVGLGNIGRRVAEIFTAFGARVIHFSPSGKNQSTQYERVSLKELVELSDVVTIHAPLVKETMNLISAEMIGRMKKGAILINVGRGGIVDEAALTRALNHNQIRGACLDVYETEPIPKDNPLLHLVDPNKVVLTPHNAWSGLEVRKNLLDKVCDNVISFVRELDYQPTR